ncbi:ABC transporter substrate-binding protein [Streptomyces sp. NPDC060194]|uniref:ABC transporter substrate-binding protein n=1 Tax=Streptomyces sp. NPDC060194 TaxID=3347069 RepID=UPI00365167BD
MRARTRSARRWLVLAAAAALVAGCSASSNDGADDGEGGGTTGAKKVTLRVGTFGSFGYDNENGAKLYAEYEKLHPNVKIVESNVSDGQKYWDALKLRMSRNSGLADIQAIEVGYVAEATGPTMASKWVDFKEEAEGYPEWKNTQATTPDGAVIGLGTDIGPMAVCYNKDLFKAAGLPTDRAKVAELWAGDWAKFVETGKTYQKKAPKGTAFTDSASGLFNAVLSSQPQQYSDDEGKLVYDSSEGVKTAWDLAVDAAEAKITAKLRQFDEGGTWNAAYKAPKFATVACPSWMTGIIAEQSGPKNKGKWDIAAPPQNGNWGGAFLGVPKSGKNVEEASKLAAWLTAPEQQTKVFGVNGNIPSRTGALESAEVKAAKLDYFGDTPVGEIYTAIAADVTSAPIGRYDGQVKTFLTDNGILDIETRGTAPDKAWDNVKKLVDDKIDQ